MEFFIYLLFSVFVSAVIIFYACNPIFVRSFNGYMYIMFIVVVVVFFSVYFLISCWSLG